MRNRRPGRKSFVKTVRSMLLSERGFSLSEVMITVGVLSIVALGTSVLFSDMFAVQKRGNSVVMIQQMRTEIIGALTKSKTAPTNPMAPNDPTSAWEAIVAHASNTTIDCIRNKTACGKDDLHRINVVNVRGEEIFNSLTPTRGFNLNGQLCNTYSAATPDPACPFRWDIDLITRCVGTNKTACENPTIEAVGTLQFSPGTSDLFNGPFNKEPYAFSVRRGEKNDLNQPFVLAYVNLPATVDPETDAHPQKCKDRWVTRKLNRIISDPGKNVQLVGNALRLEAGGYDCRIQVPTFKSGTNRIRLINSGDTIFFESGVATAAVRGGSAVVTLQATFVISGQQDFRIEHTCTALPSDTAFGNTDPNYVFGVPSPIGADYTDAKLSVVSCLRTS